KLYEAHPHFADLDEIAATDHDGIAELAKRKGGRVLKAPFTSPVKDFYLTNPIARASAVMAECSQRANGSLLEAAE
ncbi:MAG: NADH-quinone oxidoreductase subunit G, partial [Pseudomonadota bacterium]